jgi:diacylglycerol kinase family enzyme
MSGPLVRSSYRAGRLHAEAMARRAAPAGVAPAGVASAGVDGITGETAG